MARAGEDKLDTLDLMDIVDLDPWDGEVVLAEIVAFATMFAHAIHPFTEPAVFEKVSGLSGQLAAEQR